MSERKPFELPEGSPAAPLAAALVRLGDELTDPEAQALLPPGIAAELFGGVVAAVHLLHVREVASQGHAADAFDAMRRGPEAA